MKNRLIQWIILLVLFAATGWFIYTQFIGARETIQIGKAAPDFTVNQLDGDTFTLSGLRGKGILINFWATYCPYCIDEMPLIESKYRKYKEKGLVVIGINTGESKVAAQGYVNRLGVTFPIGMDEVLEVTKAYQTGPLPRSIFIGPDGIVKGIYLGEMDEKIIEENIAKILPAH